MASGYNNEPPASEFRRYTSWGRTRSPKNILSSHRAGTNAVGAAKRLADAVPESFITENQRYLHVVVTAVGAGATLTVEGEMYAAATYNAQGNPSAFEAIPLKDTSGTPMTGLGEGRSLIEIGGMDRVKFTADGGTVDIYAACSTFSMT